MEQAIELLALAKQLLERTKASMKIMNSSFLDLKNSFE